MRAIAARVSSPGLQARLGLAFAAVAVLAVAANLLAERSVRIVEQVWSAQPEPEAQLRMAASQGKPRGAAAPASGSTTAAPASAPARPVLDVEDFIGSVEDYERAVQSRIASPEPAVVRQLQSSTLTLESRVKRFTTAIADAPRSQRQALAQELGLLTSTSEAAIATADRRRTLLVEYRTAVDVLSERVRERLDGALRLFGRVIARQQMVELRNRTDELRRQAAVLDDAFAYDAQDTEALAAIEQQLGALVPEPQRRSSRAAGTPSWEEDVRTQLAAMRSAREALLAQDLQAREVEAERVALLGRLAGRIRSLPSMLAVKRVAKAAPGAEKPAPATTPVQTVLRGAAGPLKPPAATPFEVRPLPSLVPRTVVREETRAPPARSMLIWISTAVVLLTLAVSVLTVRSLVRQVSRLLEGIRRVARGESASVEAGGIRELDVLAEEFNAMSARLAAAREDNERYQQELERRVAERTAQLHYQAAHDPLTQLPNRRELHRLLGETLDAAREARCRVGVFLIDLDNFKVLNDSMGHGFGDRVLVAMAQRLKGYVPEGGFAARLGGDEFTVVMGAVEDDEAIRATGMALVRAFQQPLSVDGRELLLSVSVGASIFPDHEEDAEALLRAADSALFRAKALGRSQLALFETEMLDAAAARFSTEQALRRAVERGEFELHYQPEIDLATFEVRVLEALLRWRLPDGRLLAPAEFLAVAEESGLITDISAWVLREAVAAASRWREAGWEDVRIAVNVSSRQLVDQGFAGTLGALLQSRGLPPSAIEVELTESVLQTGAHTIRTLEALRALGIPTALDDFGAGYSSLASLELLPLTRVKLDRSLVASIDENPRSTAIARAIIQLCDGLGLEVTAEGVERVPQFQLLLRHQPLLVQGYLFARPMPESEVLAARAAMAERLAGLLLALPAPHRTGQGAGAAGSPALLTAEVLAN